MAHGQSGFKPHDVGSSCPDKQDYQEDKQEQEGKPPLVGDIWLTLPLRRGIAEDESLILGACCVSRLAGIVEMPSSGWVGPIVAVYGVACYPICPADTWVDIGCCYIDWRPESGIQERRVGLLETEKSVSRGIFMTVSRCIIRLEKLLTLGNVAAEDTIEKPISILQSAEVGWLYSAVSEATILVTHLII